MLRCFVMACLSLCVYACKSGNPRYTKYNDGLFYRIVKQGDGEVIQRGQIAKLYMKQLYGDSVLYDNTDSVAFYQVHDTTVISPAAYALFSKVTKGDSIIFKALTDSIFRNKLPHWAKRHTWLFTHVYVGDVLPVGYNYQQELKNEMRKRNGNAMP